MKRRENLVWSELAGLRRNTGNFCFKRLAFISILFLSFGAAKFYAGFIYSLKAWMLWSRIVSWIDWSTFDFIMLLLAWEKSEF